MASNFHDEFRQRYRASSSYADSGRIIVGDDEIQFRTFFQRPNRYRFQCRSMKDRAGSWFTAANSGTDDLSGPALQHLAPTLESVIVSTTSVSRGIGPMVARLLLPELDTVGISLREMIDAAGTKEELVNEHLCRQCLLEIRRGRTLHMWIDQHDLSLVKLVMVETKDLPPISLFSKIEEIDPNAAAVLRENSELVDIVYQAHFDSVQFDLEIPRSTFILG